MKLKYKILWYDNDKDWVESIEEDVKEIIEEYCFEPEITLRSKDDDKKYKDFDLVLMDLNLEDEPSGDKLIESIRQMDVYTDVLFYSADGISKIKSKAQELGLEGVYFSGRDKDAFIEKLRKVFLSTIYKEQDLNNLRGLVMAEVSELDVKMEEILHCYFVEKGCEDKSQKFHKHITAKVEENIKSKLSPNPKSEQQCSKDCIHIWNSKEMKDIIVDFDFDAYKKARSINRIIKDIRYNYQSAGVNFLEDYRSDIIDVRNNLAHCQSVIIDGKEYIVTKKIGAADITYTDEDFKQIRSNIRKYRKVLDAIYGAVSGA